MCGIAGKINFRSQSISESSIRTMAKAISHRGPDDEGVYRSPTKSVALAHRRLAIIDLSTAGHQPMSYLNRYWIVFNGEIYNFQEHRTQLEKEGVVFRSQTDTEVILALYHKYGNDCVQYLRGMFAFAIYDELENLLFCARDRVGKKPFKYYYDKQVFLFASELKAILTQPEYKAQPDYEAISHYLTLAYCPAPYTGFKGIKKLEAGHYLTVECATGKMETKRYWQLEYRSKLMLSEQDWSTRIMNKLEESVKIRMVSDVPIGAFLSGGIDSSAVVGLMSRLSRDPVRTFSIGFPYEQYSELGFAKQISEKFGTQHTEFIVEPHAIEILPDLVAAYEEPYADSSALPTYYVSKLTREHVTVALNGDGGDENFAGYSRYSAQKFGLAYERLLALHRHSALPLAREIEKRYPSLFTERLHRFARTLQEPYQQRYVGYTAFFTAEQKAKLMTDDFRSRAGEVSTYSLIGEKFMEAGTSDRLDQTFYADISTYLPDDLLAKVDIATMQVGLEGRSPFLDHEFMELAARIPNDLKLKGLTDKKYILKKALSSLLPHEIMYRPKRGFSIPLAEWLRGELHDYAKDLLFSSESNKRGLMNQGYVRSLFDAHQEGKMNYAHHLWALVTLELWFRKYFPMDSL